MEVVRVRMYYLMIIAALVSSFLIPSLNAQAPAPAPSTTNDGIAIDQGVAYVLMLLALVLTYIFH